jgi:hypothetical protein
MGARFIVKANKGDPFFSVVDTNYDVYLPEGHWKSAGCWLSFEAATVLSLSLNYTHETLLTEIGGVS